MRWYEAWMRFWRGRELPPCGRGELWVRDGLALRVRTGRGRRHA